MSNQSSVDQAKLEENTTGLAPGTLLVPSSWSAIASGMKGRDDIESISSGEAMADSPAANLATTSSDQPLTPDSKPDAKNPQEDEESPTDVFLRRLHEDENFG